MKNRILRGVLVALALVAQGAAGFVLVRTEARREASRQALAAVVRDAGRAQALLGELRGAEAALVSPGQDSADWVPRAARLARDAGGALESIGQSSLSPDAREDLAAASRALASFSRASDKVRDLLATDQPFTAASVVFGDAFQQLGTAAAALSSVAPTEAAARDREVSRQRILEASALGGAAAVTLLVLLLLLPRIQPPAGDSEANPAAAGLGLSMALRTAGGTAEAGHAPADLDVGYRAGQAGAGPVAEPARESEQDLEEDTRRETGLPLNTEAEVDLAEAARLCGDLARVKDGGELDALLARAAELLDAAGIVLWIAEPGGTALRPAASHGYSEHALARMKALSGRSEHAVAMAFRSGTLEVVRGTRERPGAVVAPIVTAGGTVGAMAAEIRHGGETSGSVQAVAAILAAQLASLVADTTTS